MIFVMHCNASYKRMMMFVSDCCLTLKYAVQRFTMHETFFKVLELSHGQNSPHCKALGGFALSTLERIKSELPDGGHHNLPKTDEHVFDCQ